MLIYAKVKINKIWFYHTTEVKREIIKNTNEFKKLRKNIKKNGILDPIVIEAFSPDFLRIHVGEERLLLANELKIDKLKAFIYTKYPTKHKPHTGRKITDVKQIQKYFRNKGMLTPKGRNTIPAYSCLCDYIRSGVITL